MSSELASHVCIPEPKLIAHLMSRSTRFAAYCVTARIPQAWYRTQFA